MTKNELDRHIAGYLKHTPKLGDVPAGMVVVHNRVSPTGYLGLRGFRAWLQVPGEPPAIEPCPCDWARELRAQHYRVIRRGL